MQPGLEWIALYGAVAVLYGLIAWRYWVGLADDVLHPPPWVAVALPVALLLHALLLWHGMAGDDHLRFGFAHALSATLLLTVTIVWIEGFFQPTHGLLLLVLPPAAIAVLLPPLFPGSMLSEATGSTLFRLHLLMAILSYSLLTIAALYALLMATMDRQLHRERAGARSPIARLVDRLPPLLAMETVLFRLVGLGFVLLTATLVSGVFFSEELFDRPLRFDHKTVFTIASWLVFGGLLVGRAFFGWRGRTALRWTLTGFIMLVFAYVGYRFVLEVVLQRA